MLSVGIIGLPNVGKSTLFNALTATAATVSNYPFTTVEANVGTVPVPDPRLEELDRLLSPRESVPSTIQFVDIAGLVEGASRGEGLGNRFLGNIRQVDALLHVIRCFTETEVAHVLESVDPARDLRVIERELLAADLEVLEKAIEKQQRVWKTDPRRHEATRRRWLACRDQLARGKPLHELALDAADQRELKGLGLLTGKPVLLVANVSEGGENPLAGEAIAVSAQLEWELQQLEPAERREFMQELGLDATGLERLVREAFQALGLITFYTIANRKLRAWEIPRGTRAPEAAGRVHSDMERGFIRARVAAFEDIREAGGVSELATRGRVRTEGKEYEIRDGDVVEFLFSR